MTRRAAVLPMVGGGFPVSVALFRRHVHLAMEREAWFGGVLGEAFTALWGGLGLIHVRRRTWAVLTLTASAFVLLSQMVKGRTAAGQRARPGSAFLWRLP